jgi:hypothetical protein
LVINETTLVQTCFFLSPISQLKRKKWREKFVAKNLAQKNGAKNLARKIWHEKFGAKNLARKIWREKFGAKNYSSKFTKLLVQDWS